MGDTVHQEASKIRIVVIGAGAMGSLFAWHLAATEAQVWAYDTWRKHIDAVRRNGLSARRGGKAHTRRLNASTDPREAGLADIAMVFVKFGQTRAALDAARPMIGPDTIIVTLQNGIGNVEIIRDLFPANRVVYGLTTLTSELLGPGDIDASYEGQGETYLWPDDGEVDETVQAICGLLNAGGVSTAIASDIALEIWKKLVVNCCLNTMCAITGLSVGPLTDRADVWPVLDGVVDEVVSAAALKGIGLQRSDAHRYLRTVAAEARAHEPSMLIDLRQRRTTEIDCLNGAVLAVCDSHGVSAPFNRTLYTIVRAIESSWTPN